MVLAAHKRWLQSFRQALAENNHSALLTLTAQAESRPGLSALGGNELQGRTPLEWAIRERSAWGVEQMLTLCRSSTQGGLGLAELECFFEVLGNFYEQRHWSDAQQMLDEIWPQVRSVVEKSMPGRLHALGAFLKYFPHPDNLARTRWEALGMNALVQGIVDTPFHPVGIGSPMTALQLAWINGLHVAVELLMDAGASAIHCQPTTVLPDWTLASATVERDLVCAQGMGSLRVQAHAKQRWIASTPTIAESLGDAMVLVCDFRSEWKNVDKRVRAQELSHGLPAALPRRLGPRF